MFDFKCSANCCVSARCCLGKCHTTQGTDIISVSVGWRRNKKMLAYSKFSHDVAEKKEKKSWNIFKWLLIIQLGADWLPVMCWPLRVQSKSTGVSAPRGATVILGCGSSCPANVSRALLHSPPPPISSRIKTSQYAQQLHSGGEGMRGMCLQHHNPSPLSHGLIWPKPRGDRTINTYSTLQLCFSVLFLKG